MATAYASPAGVVLSQVRAGASRPSQKAHDLCTRWQEMLQARSQYEFEWQDLVDLVFPAGPDIITKRAVGAQRTDRLFDTTAVQASQTLAANIMGAVTNPAFQWFRLGFRDQRVADDQQVAAWLNAIDEIMLGAYNASNFYQAAHTYYLNLGVFGTAAMYVDTMQRMNKNTLEAYLRFRTIPTGTYCITESADGKVDTLFRCFPLTPRQAMQRWGNECSPQLREKAKQPGLMDKEVEFLHCVYPRADVQPGKLGNRNMPYASVYMELDTRHICDETGYEEFPYLVSRWEASGTAPWGFGPGHMALPDIRVLNVLKELNLEQLERWVRPTLQALHEGVIGQISLEPLAVNYVSAMDNLRTLDLTGRPDQVQLNQEILTKSIRDMFFADALQGLPPVDATQMTAFEVSQRIEMMQRLMGPAFTRLLSEMLDPLADRVFGLLWRAGVLPPVPRAVVIAAQRNQGQLDVEYEGPLARAQRGAEVKAISEVLAVANQIALSTQSVEIYDNFDLDGMAREVAHVNGLPRHLVKDTYQVQQVRSERQQQQQQMQQAALAEQQASAMGKMAPMVELMRQPAQQAA